MAYPGPTPHRQQDHISPSPDAYAATQGCSCSWCSATRHYDPPVGRTMVYQNPWLPDDPAILLANQILGADSSTGVGAMANAQPQAQFVAPQGYDTVGYAPVYEEARFPQAQTNAGLDQPQVINAQVTESLRRLAGRLVNNPESIVNVLRIEPSATGRFRVVIILEIADDL